MSAQPEFFLNPDLDLSPYVDTYRQRKIVQIPNIFEEKTADAIYQMLRTDLLWRILVTDAADAPKHFSQEEWAGMDEAERSNILEGVFDRARKNRGFHYHTYPMIEAYLGGWDQGHAIHKLTELINSPTFISLGQMITGVPGINKAEAHACQYTKGHYLTRHVDDGAERKRRAAYVLGFTKGWQPDWGGLLLFLKNNQDVDHGFLPRFNNVTIFDIECLHTVTQISSFAQEPRLTVTGWFRDDAIPGRQR